MNPNNSTEHEKSLNPFLKPILNAIDEYFNQQPKTNEHAIIKHLQNLEIAPFNDLNLGFSQDLFHAHFLCMHALYTLKLRYEAYENMSITIQSVRIERTLFRSSRRLSNATHINMSDPLAAYYLDPKHYFETQEDDINAMLKSFWKKYLNQDQRQKALDTLNLPIDADNELINKQFRRLAQKHHPDKGGDANEFKKIQQARALLLN